MHVPRYRQRVTGIAVPVLRCALRDAGNRMPVTQGVGRTGWGCARGDPTHSFCRRAMDERTRDVYSHPHVSPTPSPRARYGSRTPYPPIPARFIPRFSLIPRPVMRLCEARCVGIRGGSSEDTRRFSLLLSLLEHGLNIKIGLRLCNDLRKSLKNGVYPFAACYVFKTALLYCL